MDFIHDQATPPKRIHITPLHTTSTTRAPQAKGLQAAEKSRVAPHLFPPDTHTQLQVKGLQAEYERVTAKPAEAGAGKGGGAGAAAGEVDEWKGKVDKLIREKGEQQAG